MGPKIWKKPLHFRNGGAGGNNGTGMDGSGTEFSVMNIDEFLNENNFDFDHFPSKISEDDRDHGMAVPSNGGNSYKYELFHRSKFRYFANIKIILSKIIYKA